MWSNFEDYTDCAGCVVAGFRVLQQLIAIDESLVEKQRQFDDVIALDDRLSLSLQLGQTKGLLCFGCIKRACQAKENSREQSINDLQNGIRW
ncbi:hypothetical protein P3S67_030241 [Capsicum chacoense]